MRRLTGRILEDAIQRLIFHKNHASAAGDMALKRADFRGLGRGGASAGERNRKNGGETRNVTGNRHSLSCEIRMNGPKERAENG